MTRDYGQESARRISGGGKPDYALEVRAGSGHGLLMCRGSGAPFLPGAGIGGARFSDREQDRFFARHWAVYTKREVLALGAFQSNVPRPLPRIKGEATAMIREDGISLIYWDGAGFSGRGVKSGAALAPPPERSRLAKC
jgi:hypothetical protein